jgi:hypothetical protein
MSHQVMVKTQIKDRNVLESTLSELGYSFRSGGRLVAYRGEDAGEVDIMVNIKGHDNKVGFRFSNKENCYEIVGDFWNTNVSQQDFTSSIKKNYVEKKVTALLAAKRYVVVNKKVERNGAIKMVARSMVA